MIVGGCLHRNGHAIPDAQVRAIRHPEDPRRHPARGIVVSMPEPPPQPEGVDGGFGPGPFLEGGDVMLFGDDIWSE